MFYSVLYTDGQEDDGKGKTSQMVEPKAMRNRELWNCREDAELQPSQGVFPTSREGHLCRRVISETPWTSGPSLASIHSSAPVPHLDTG